jgi:hypothetical protein
LPSPIALAVKATNGEALYDRRSDFKGVDDETDTEWYWQIRVDVRGITT